MNNRLIIGIVVVIIIAIIASVFAYSQIGVQQNFLQPAQSTGSISLKLTDSETGKSVGRVGDGYVRVLIGGVDKGYLTDNGELQITDIDAGTKELTLIIPHYGEKRQNIDVASAQNTPINIVVDMPNPVFDVTVNCDTKLGFLDEYGDITVSLTNRGDVNSDCTSVLILVYTDEDTSTPIATHMFDFPSLVPRKDGGQTYTSDSWTCTAFKWGPKEVITAVVFDGWEYTPQNQQIVSQISAPSSLVAEVSNSVANYLTSHPEVVVETVSKVALGWFG
jgi:hypothetical protein